MAEQNTNTLNTIIDDMQIYYGNMVYRDGHICNAIGKKLEFSDAGTVRIHIDGKIRTLKAGRIVYEAFHKVKLTYSHVIVFKDGNALNPALDNLILVSRKEYFKDYDWSNTGNCRHLTKSQESEIKDMKKNGIFNPDTGEYESVSYENLAKIYGVSKSTIYKILKN